MRDTLPIVLDAADRWEDESYDNTVYVVEDELGRAYEINLADGGHIRPIPPF